MSHDSILSKNYLLMTQKFGNKFRLLPNVILKTEFWAIFASNVSFTVIINSLKKFKGDKNKFCFQFNAFQISQEDDCTEGQETDTKQSWFRHLFNR